MQSCLKYILVCLLVSFRFLNAQNPVFEHMAEVSKLPDVEFYDILEDQHHYIWLAGNKGLYRYDGKLYVKFSHPEQKANSLFQLKLDADGKLWCNNIYGQIFYIENNALNLFYDAHQLVKGQLAPFEVRQDALRLFTATGVYDIDITTKAKTKIFDGMCISSASQNQTDYTSIVNIEGQEKSHRIYKLENKNSTKILDLENHKRVQSPKLFAFEDAVIFTHKSSLGNVIYLINKQTNSTKIIQTPKQIKNQPLYNLLKFKDTYWFLTSSGVFVFSFHNYQFQFKKQLFKTETVTDVALDFNGNYWFSTLDNGVFVSPNLGITHTNLSAVNAKITASCALENNSFVLGTNDGRLLVYDQNHLKKTFQLPGVKKIIGNLFFYAETQQLIVSINASESYIVNLKNDKIVDVSNRFSVAKTFSKIDDNTLFYGNYKEGIVYENPLTSAEKNSLRTSRVKASLVSDNALFVSYLDGFFSYDSNTWSSREIQFNQKRILVNAMAKTNAVVWLATQHNGLLKFENDTLKSSGIQLPEQLQINAIKSEGDVLWIASDLGLYHYHTKTQQLKALNAQDGLNTAVNNFLVLKDYIIVAMPKAFYLLPKKEDLYKAYKTARVRIESVHINDRDTLVKSQYKLPYDSNKIAITFNSNGYQSNKHVQYHYRVKELDSAWQKVPINTHVVNFNSLSSGRYSFELKAQNVSAQQAVFAKPIRFVIAKPFWETYWFYALVLGVFFGLVWLYFRWRLKQKEAQRILEIDKILADKKITNLKLENLRSQMNPHFIFNALNSIQDYIISNEKELASSYLVKFSRLIRKYLDYSQQNEITLQQEFEALNLYLQLEKVRFEDELQYTVNIDKTLNTRRIKVPSLFIQPYVENALKHGLLHKPKDRQLQVEASVFQQKQLQITIEDNGIGRQASEDLKRPSQQHKPFATKANQERVRLYNIKLKRNIRVEIEDLEDENSNALGTKVLITMPLQ